MVSNNLKDMSSTNLNELIEPKLGKSKSLKPVTTAGSVVSKATDLNKDGEVDSFEKNVRQLIYDARHLARKKMIPLEAAFRERSSKVKKYTPEVIKAAKEKLGVKSSVSEENVYEADGQEMISVVITYKNGTVDRRRVPRAEIARLRAKPTISSVELTKYGVASKDYDRDGKIESGEDEHAGSVHNAIQRKIGGVPDGNPPTRKIAKRKMKSYGVSEGFSNWRQELFEIVDDGIDSDSKDTVKEKKVNNYVGKKPVVQIAPNLGMQESIENLGGELLKIEDISEDYLIENLYSDEIEIATEYFYEQGLNEYGLDILIEKLGVDEFCDYIEDISENYCLLEWRRGPGGTKIRGSQMSKSGKHISTLKGGAKASAIRATGEHKSRKSERETPDNSESQMKSALKSQSEKARRVATKTAVVKQPSTDKKPEETKKEVKKGIFGALKDRASRDTELLKKSWQTARDVGREHEKNVRGAVKTARTIGKTVEQHPKVVAARQQAGKTLKKTLNAAAGAANDAIDARSSGRTGAETAGRALGGFVRRMRQNEQYELIEKITGKTDVGMAIKDFQSSTSPRLKGRSKEQRRKAAIAAVLTARRGGEKLKEAVMPQTTREIQQDTENKQQATAQNTLQQQKERQQKTREQKFTKAILAAKSRANSAGNTNITA